jgi:hypothetical protein
MNLYIYDDYLKKYKKTLNNLEIQLHNLNLNGKIINLENVKKLDQAIKDEINMGIKTIVAVGNNRTLNKVLNAILNNNEISASNLSLGIIPIGGNNSIAEALGIKNDIAAGEIILARRLEKINIAKANNTYFISEANIRAKGTTLHLENFTIDSTQSGQIRLINLLTDKSSSQNIKSDPQDGLIDLYIYNSPKKQSFFSIKRIEIENTTQKILIDNSIEINCPAKIEQIDQKISLIVSKSRLF